MKILLTTNKTLTSSDEKHKWIDGGYYNIYLPLKELGYDVYFWDTVNPENPDYLSVVDNFDPDLIFSCITGDLSIAPHEKVAVESIAKITKSSNIKTFNWFCDDTWRFNQFSSKVCWLFTACSTPEPEYVRKYKDIGYHNIFVGGWHINDSYYPKKSLQKKYDVSFIGQLNNKQRIESINYLRQQGINVENFHGLSHEEMIRVLSQSKIGINFSKNYNGSPVKTQMKLRPFEIAAAKDTLVLSENHSGLEYFFDIDREIVTFNTKEEAAKKIKILLNNDKMREKIASNGNKRFKKEHSSKKRMQEIIERLEEI